MPLLLILPRFNAFQYNFQPELDATVVGAARLRLDFERAHEAEKKR